MDTITLIVDAPTLIDHIHGLKQWIYDGSIHIAVPACTVDDVERQYQASLKPKEDPKESAAKRTSGKSKEAQKGPVAKKASGRAARREEQPLFDINPRTAWEFLSRERDEARGASVNFQKEGEEFAQWKEEDSAPQEVENSLPAPSSFADALLRKLNITDGPSPNVTKGPVKPKLVPKIIDSKSPWKTPNVPIVPSEGVPSNLKQFFAYVLWRLYEAPKDSLQPTKNVVLADGVRMKNIAANLGVPIRQWAELRQVVHEEIQTRDHRSSQGQLEREFPHRLARMDSSKPLGLETTSEADSKQQKQKPERNLNEDSPAQNNNTVIQHAGISENKEDINGSEQAHTVGQHEFPTANGHTTHNSTTEPPMLQSDLRHSPEAKTQMYQSLDYTGNSNSTGSQVQPTENGGSDVDSDEDIIVFNPRSKRASGLRPRTPGGTSEPSQSRPVTAHGPGNDSTLTPKSPIKSTLKPQSPVFTPGQIYTAVGAGLTENTSRSTYTSPTNGYQPVPLEPASKSPPTMHAEPLSAKFASHNGKGKQLPTDEARRQQSEIILQRQREAIQRQAKSNPKPTPRKIQMEPTDHPIVIDPDDFDRSYVLEPPSQPAERGGGGRRRTGGRQRPPSRGNATNTKGPKAEPGDDFVLKSGAPRGSMRGKGKLFVP